MTERRKPGGTPVEIFRSASSIEVEVVRGLLDAHGIDSHASAALSPTLFPLRFTQTQFQITVPSASATNARELIASHLDEAAATEVRRLTETLGPLEAHLGHKFDDLGLLEHALTHRSRAAEDLSGGVMATVVGDCMQRAPVFVFDSARGARDFVFWVEENLATIREHAEGTSSVAKLLYIDPYLANKMAFLRFNYSTGDAAGQNMVGRATFAACSWILEQVKTVRRFYLESNLATDKKASQVNIMNTRGKRVIAEATIPRETLVQNMRVEPETLHYHASIANVGTMLSGANNNGAHSPNAITAMFIATGQDVANVSESSAAIAYTEVTKEGDLYISITLPSLIIATHGGGTGLPTQKECLEIMGCVGKGKVKKLAEIIAGTVLAGELSLGAAISSLDWVSSHEQYGRNR